MRPVGLGCEVHAVCPWARVCSSFEGRQLYGHWCALRLPSGPSAAGGQVPIVPPQPACGPAKMWGLHSTVQGAVFWLPQRPLLGPWLPVPGRCSRLPSPEQIPTQGRSTRGLPGALQRWSEEGLLAFSHTHVCCPAGGVEALSPDPHWPACHTVWFSKARSLLSYYLRVE